MTSLGIRPYEKGLVDLGGGGYAWLQPDGGWGWSNAGLISDGERALLVDTLFDLRLTADNQVVVFHDADAWRLCASRMTIGTSTLAEIERLSIGGFPIPTLESLHTLVAGRVPLLLEVKTERDVWRWVPALRQALSGYDGRFGVMSFDARIPRLLKTNLPSVRRGLVVRADLSPLRRAAALWLADPDFIAVDRAALDQPWVSRLRRRVPMYSWTIRTAGERRQAEVQADALIWEGDGRPRD